MPITFAEWRKEKRIIQEGIEQPLLSGLVVRMRPVQPDTLLRSGRVPDLLTPLVIKSLYESVREELDAFVFEPRKQTEETLQMIESVNVVVEAALVYPRVVAKPTADDEIAIDELSLSDRMWIFRLAFMPAELLSRFRYEPPRDVEAVADEQGDAQQAEPVDVREG